MGNRDRRHRRIVRTSEGFPVLARGGVDVPKMAKWPFLHIATTRSWAKENPDLVVRFLRGWYDAVGVTYDPARKDEVIKILAKRLNVDAKYVTSAYQNWIVDQKVYSKDGKINPEGLQVVIDGMIELGDVQTPGPKPADLYDGSYLQQAMSSR